MKKHTCTCGPACACKNCTCSKRATLFDTLGNTGRLAILTALRNKPQSVTELTERTGLEQTAVSHALRKLASAKLVQARKHGKQRIYAIDDEGAQIFAHLLSEHLLGKHKKATS
jgi:DNA-binding transcriptional ArsR family regulator